MKVTEGFMPFLGYESYYRIVGEPSSEKKPLLLLHGGPGSSHAYFQMLDEVAKDGRQVIMYDQLGSGRSATPSRPDLWNKETWVKELISLREYLNLDEVHILGQSWGGMLAIIYECEYKPKGVKSYILSSTLASAEIWEREQRRRIKYLPEHMQEAIEEAEKSGDYSSKEYADAVDEFMDRHCGPTITEDSPECLKAEKPESGKESYLVAWGQSEFAPRGTLKDYNYTEEIKDIKVPCLVTSGLVDLSSPLISKQLYDNIPNSKWELFEHSRHMPFVEENEKYIRVLIDWLNEND